MADNENEVVYEEVTDPMLLDSTGQQILGALNLIKNAVQPTNVGVDMPVSIPVSAWPNSAPYEFTWLSNKVTPECVVSVGYGEGAEDLDTLYLYATKVAGGVKFTAPEKPVMAVPVVIHILNAAAESVTAVNADMVATSAVSGASNVDEALGIHEEAIADHADAIGDLTSLTTTEKGSLVAAANELNSELGSPSSASAVTGNDAFSKINALNSKITEFKKKKITGNTTSTGAFDPLIDIPQYFIISCRLTSVAGIAMWRGQDKYIQTFDIYLAPLASQEITVEVVYCLRSELHS